MYYTHFRFIYTHEYLHYFNVMVGYIAHVLFIELWSPITFEPITNSIVSIRHTIFLTELNKNNYIARLAKDLFKSYEYSVKVNILHFLII